MSLLDRHLGFLDALRRAGLPVSTTEDLDAMAALALVPWADRDLVRDVYSGTVVKKHLHRPTFDALFDLYFPQRIGGGVEDAADWAEKPDAPTGDNLDVLESMRRRIQKVLEENELDARLLSKLAGAAVSSFGKSDSAPARWSMYETLQRLDMQSLTNRLIERLTSEGTANDEADAVAQARVGRFVQAVHDDIERRIAESESPERRGREMVQPVLDGLDFTAARESDIVAMRHEIAPLARRLATRLARERRAHGGGALDFRRTIRASTATGGVPLVTHHRAKRPHRTDVVVLCDISGSVADFARFTLMLVFALRDVFQSLRAFTFVDDVTEVTDRLRPGADLAEVLIDLAGSTRQALLSGKSDYGSVFTRFAAEHADILTPRTTLLVLGDARSNYSSLGRTALTAMADRVKHAYWLNPEPRSRWGLADSAADEYANIIEMVECRNLNQLSSFVHGLA